MDALIEREQKFAAEAVAADNARAQRSQTGAPKNAGKGSIRSRPAPVASMSRAIETTRSVERSEDDDDDDDEDDEELREHGSIVPDQLSDPSSTALGDAFAGRRVYVEGLVQRKDINRNTATIIDWRHEHARWEIEMDKRDERLLVRSTNLRWLDIPAPATNSAKRSSTAGDSLAKKLKGKKVKKNP